MNSDFLILPNILCSVTRITDISLCSKTLQIAHAVQGRFCGRFVSWLRSIFLDEKARLERIQAILRQADQYCESNIKELLDPDCLFQKNQNQIQELVLTIKKCEQIFQEIQKCIAIRPVLNALTLNIPSESKGLIYRLQQLLENGGAFCIKRFESLCQVVVEIFGFQEQTHRIEEHLNNKEFRWNISISPPCKHDQPAELFKLPSECLNLIREFLNCQAYLRLHTVNRSAYTFWHPFNKVDYQKLPFPKFLKILENGHQFKYLAFNRLMQSIENVICVKDLEPFAIYTTQLCIDYSLLTPKKLLLLKQLTNLRSLRLNWIAKGNFRFWPIELEQSSQLTQVKHCFYSASSFQIDHALKMSLPQSVKKIHYRCNKQIPLRLNQIRMPSFLLSLTLSNLPNKIIGQVKSWPKTLSNVRLVGFNYQNETHAMLLKQLPVALKQLYINSHPIHEELKKDQSIRQWIEENTSSSK